MFFHPSIKCTQNEVTMRKCKIFKAFFTYLTMGVKVFSQAGTTCVSVSVFITIQTAACVECNL